MRLGRGVEWAVHVLLNLAWTGSAEPVSVSTLAAGHDLPRAYLNKQLQQLVKAGLLESEPGARGGFRLARDSTSITLLDVVDAIEGREPVFRCGEIRQCGTVGECTVSDFVTVCAVKASMDRAESAWREALASQTLTDVRSRADAHAPAMTTAVRRAFRLD